MGSIYKRGRVYWIKYYHRGHPIRESSKSEKISAARELLAIREGDSKRGKTSAITGKIKFSELLDDLLVDYELNNRKSIKIVYYQITAHILPFFADMLASEINGRIIQKYAHSRKQDGVSNSAIRNELALISRAFNLAAENGILEVVPVVKRPKPDPPRTDSFTDEEFEKFRDKAIYYLVAIGTFAIWTGWRMGEILRLKWSEVNFNRSEIRINPGESKNDQVRVLVMTPELHALLLYQFRQTQESNYPDCEYVFNRNGSQIKNFRTAWDGALKRAKLKGHTFHGFRRTLRNKLDERGISEKVGMAIMGHKTRNVYDSYRVVKRSELEDAAAKLSGAPGTVWAQDALDKKAQK